jgi:hypothetical protein
MATGASQLQSHTNICLTSGLLSGGKNKAGQAAAGDNNDNHYMEWLQIRGFFVSLVGVSCGIFCVTTSVSYE